VAVAAVNSLRPAYTYICMCERERVCVYTFECWSCRELTEARHIIYAYMHICIYVYMYVCVYLWTVLAVISEPCVMIYVLLYVMLHLHLCVIHA
jgi:hypothetical protein